MPRRTTSSESPTIIKAGNVTVRIYFEPEGKRRRWSVVYRQMKERVRKRFPTLEKAKTEAEAIAERLHAAQQEVLELTALDRDSFLYAKQKLGPLKIPLHAAIAEYARCVELLAGVPPLVAAQDYHKRHGTRTGSKSLPDAVAAFLKEKSKDASHRYLSTLKSHLTRLAVDHSKDISTVKARDLEKWLEGLGAKGRNWNNLRDSVVTLFRWSAAKGYLPKGTTEAEALPKRRDKGGEVGIFTPEQMEEMLSKAEGEVRPYLALAGFCGLRHAELMRLHWADVRWGQKVVIVGAAKAKTAQRRIIPIQPNLAAWLEPYRGREGAIITKFSLLQRDVTPLARACGWQWPPNGLRHSYGSYRLAQCKSAAEVALELGNTVRMVFQHYREAVSAAEGEKWFAITPRNTTEGV